MSEVQARQERDALSIPGVDIDLDVGIAELEDPDEDAESGEHARSLRHEPRPPCNVLGNDGLGGDVSVMPILGQRLAEERVETLSGHERVRQVSCRAMAIVRLGRGVRRHGGSGECKPWDPGCDTPGSAAQPLPCLLYTSDAADE